MNVGYIENGDWIKVKGVGFGAGATSFAARVASATSGGTIELHLDSATGTLVGTCSVPGTGGWQTWTDVTCPVSGATGTHDLYLRFTGGSGVPVQRELVAVHPERRRPAADDARRPVARRRAVRRRAPAAEQPAAGRGRLQPRATTPPIRGPAASRAR